VKRLVVGLLLLAAAAAAQQPPVLARRGTLTLNEASVREWLAREVPETREALLRDPAALVQFVRQRFLRQVLLEEARAQRLDQRPEVAARLEQARNEALVEALLETLGRPDPAFPSEAEVQAVYDANQARFMVPRQYRLQQLFLAVPANAAAAADAEAQRRLREWRAQATAARNRVEFAELARRHSEDAASKERGGELGWLREDRMLAPVRAAVAGLEEGAISEPLRTSDGWHLVRVLGTRPAAPQPLAEVREQIVAALRQARAQELTRAAVNELLRREPIQLDEIALGRLAAPR
jgi:peptidylprolyl isomerase